MLPVLIEDCCKLWFGSLTFDRSRSDSQHTGIVLIEYIFNHPVIVHKYCLSPHCARPSSTSKYKLSIQASDNDTHKLNAAIV